jgi:hypothetical protein
LEQLKEHHMPVNWVDIPWTAVGLLAGLAFISSLIGNSLAPSKILGAIIATIIFVAVYVAWDYYPHNMLEGVRFPNRYAK